MELRNPLTIHGADRRYARLEEWISVEMQDNHSEIIVVGDYRVESTVYLEYEFFLPIGKRKIVGSMAILVESGVAHLVYEYSFVPPEIREVSYFPSVSNNDIRIQVTTANIGEDPVFVYKKSAGTGTA